MPTVLTFALVDLVAEDVLLSRGKARKAIRSGQVEIDGHVVRDPDFRVDGDAKIIFHAQ